MWSSVCVCVCVNCDAYLRLLITCVIVKCEAY